MLLIYSSLGLLLGLILSYTTILYTRRYLSKQLKEALQKELVNSMQAVPLPEPLKETTRHCMNQAVMRFREKMPMIGGFISPAIIQSMEELMLEQLQSNWPHLVKNIVPTLSAPLVEQGLYNPSLINLWVGYSSIVGALIGLVIGLLELITH